MRRSRLWAITAAAAAALPAAAEPVEFLNESFEYDHARPAAGFWLGNVENNGTSAGWAALAIETGEQGGWKATITMLSVGAVNTACRTLEVDGKSVAFAASAFARFDGDVSDDGQRLSGTATIGTATEPTGSFELARTPRPLELERPLAYTGALKSPFGELEMTFVFAETPGGHWIGQIDVPAQGFFACPLADVSREGRAVSARLDIPRNPALIEGELSEDESRLGGLFKQAGFNLEIDFARVEGYAQPKLNRPQEPTPPYPYASREVKFGYPDDPVLAGTLTLPPGGGPFAAVVLISGSGPQDRDESLPFGHRPFLVLADYLTRRGIAVLRYDDRGTAGSTGDFGTATSDDFADDAMEAVKFMRTVDEVDPARIGLIGHSEGGLIAPIVAGRTDDVAFVVLLAGPGVPGDEILRVQLKKILEASGVEEAMIEGLRARQALALDLISSDASDQEITEAVRPAVEAELAASMNLEGEQLDELVEMQIKQLTSPWMRHFVSYDPRPVLSRVRCPVLAVNGTLDLQVWHEQNLPEIERAVTAGGGDVTIRRYEGLNHLFQPAKTGALGEYGAIEITFDEGVMNDIVVWINEHTGS